jgi:hypothetical protein
MRRGTTHQKKSGTISLFSEDLDFLSGNPLLYGGRLRRDACTRQAGWDSFGEERSESNGG